MTSFSEGFPTVVAEAMALKTPVIMTKVSGSEELIQNGKCGLLVERYSEAITEAILKILLENNNINVVVNKAYENINKYSLKRQAIEFENIFNL